MTISIFFLADIPVAVIHSHQFDLPTPRNSQYIVVADRQSPHFNRDSLNRPQIRQDVIERFTIIHPHMHFVLPSRLLQSQMP